MSTVSISDDPEGTVRRTLLIIRVRRIRDAMALGQPVETPDALRTQPAITVIADEVVPEEPAVALITA